MNQIVNKKVQLELVGCDGNAWALMGVFSHQAKREGWTKEEIDKVMTEAKSSDYSHLVTTLCDHCEAPDD